MSDFGTELGQSGLSLAEKFIDALLQLVNKVFENAGKSGYINHQLLEKAGAALTVVEISLREEDFKELVSRCEREGVLITGVEDIRTRGDSGVKSMIVECRRDDLPRLACLVDLINDEKRIAAISQEIAAIQSKGGQLTKEDVLAISGLEKQTERIRYAYGRGLNEEQARGVYESAAGGQVRSGVTFETAMDRWTGGRMDTGMKCYLVDARNPDNYIVCNSQKDVFHSTEYIKTSYQVYNDTKLVYSTDDRRFEGRQKDYWGTEKAAMRDAGNFGNLVLKFYSARELEAYREHYKELNAKTVEGLQIGSESRDYQAIIKQLEYQAEKPSALCEGMSTAGHIKTAEAGIISRQIANYSEISRLESETAIARTYVLTADQGTPEYTAAEHDFREVDHQYQKALQAEAGLLEERQGIHAVQAEQSVHSLPEPVQDERKSDSEAPQHGGRQDTPGTMAEYKQEINKIKQDRISGAETKVFDTGIQSHALAGPNGR